MTAQAAVAHDLVGIGSGCGGTGADLMRFMDLDRIWFSTRTLTLDPHPGEPGARVVESASGWVHCTGEPNPGLESFTGTELPTLVRAGARVLASVSGRSGTEIVGLVRRLGVAPGLLGVEVNLAPSSTDLVRPTDPSQAADLLSQVRAVLPGGMRLHAKLGPDHGSAHARVLARVVDALVVSGAVTAALPDGRQGQLSGPAILPVTASRVRAVRAALAGAPDLPVIAVGGVRCAGDVLALRSAGASAVQVASALLHDPTTVTSVIDELSGATGRLDQGAP